MKFTVTFRGREMAHQSWDTRSSSRCCIDLADVAVVEQSPRAEGRTVSLVLSPKASSRASSKPASKPDADKAAADAAPPAN